MKTGSNEAAGTAVKKAFEASAVKGMKYVLFRSQIISITEPDF